MNTTPEHLIEPNLVATRGSSAKAAAGLDRRGRSGRLGLGGLTRAVFALLLSLAAVVGLSGSANAAIATSYGFQCSTSGNWVRQNWPNISSDYSSLEDVTFQTVLYVWNGSAWAPKSVSPVFSGVSSSAGRHAIGYFSGSPYYFTYRATAGSSQQYIAPLLGWTYTGLPAGYYRTAEYYHSRTGNWSRWSFDNYNNRAAYCYA